MKKRILGVALAGALAFSAIGGSFVTASAVGEPDETRLDVYKPTASVKNTSTVMFAMPGSWIGEEGSDVRKTWEKYGATAGLYWWSGLDNPDDLKDNKHGWPGWKMEKVNEGEVPNLFTSLIPTGTASAIFDNFIDGGEIKTLPEYDGAKQTKDLSIEYFTYMDSDYYTNEFWNYINDNYADDFQDDEHYKVEEFGKYADNFFVNENDGEISFTPYNMVYVADYHTDRMAVSPKSGKGGYDGAFYFYYGNGEFGIWPTKELCIKMEGLTTDEEGNVVYEGTKKNAETGEDEAFKETVDEKNGFILRERTDAYDMKTKRNFVVFGNFTGKYWSDNTKDPEPTNPDAEDPTVAPTTVPAPDTDDAKSSEGSKDTSGTGSNDSNGAIATGETSALVLVSVFAIAGLGVFYFVRKRRNSK